MNHGIPIGLAAAVLQSTSYLVSAAFVRAHADRRGAGAALVARSFLAMGVVSAVALPAFCAARPGLVAPLRTWFPAALGTIAANVVAQVAMAATLRAADASRVSPLLGVKILFLALLGIVLAGDRYGSLQWGGIALSLAAAELLSRSGGRLGAAGALGVGATAAFYALSDFGIRVQQDAFHAWALHLAERGIEPLPAIGANMAILFGDYALGGAVALAAMPFTGRYAALDWSRHILPYAAVWLGAMALLYVSFDLLGVVHGTIVQSTRGLLSIGLGWALARWGGTALERRLPPGVLAGRVAAGILMFLAIVVFTLGG